MATELNLDTYRSKLTSVSAEIAISLEVWHEAKDPAVDERLGGVVDDLEDAGRQAVAVARELIEALAEARQELQRQDLLLERVGNIRDAARTAAEFGMTPAAKYFADRHASQLESLLGRSKAPVQEALDVG